MVESLFDKYHLTGLSNGQFEKAGKLGKSGIIRRFYEIHRFVCKHLINVPKRSGIDEKYVQKRSKHSGK